ncbi:hypothetical protein NE237_029143 [Protea cynaroides]|uniref:FAS1 domain-containing protein n=1 Tax=Protea cynaroides TaxID=273540 RepID=A0A9Q0GQM3_9MAGN|nr:hypothetical protein NE237_029143 [Protea cynaroides]
MASFLRSFKLLAISFVFLLSVSMDVGGIPEHELFAMVSALRSKGYHLFGNALMTSDIHYEILLGSSLTFFAPTDSALFALDMTTTASDYVQTLRIHIVPRRFSVLFLHSLPYGSSLPTLLPHHQIFISEDRTLDSNLLTVNGVDVVFPGLFYSRDIAVHGLSSILLLRHRRHSPIGYGQALPQSTANSTTNDTKTLSPIKKVADLDGISPAFSPDCISVDRCLSPAETPIANPPKDVQIAPVHGSQACEPSYDQCLSDSAEIPTANPPEEGSPVNLEGHLFKDFIPPVTPAVMPPDDRLPVDYSSKADSPDTHPNLEVHSALAAEYSMSKSGGAPVEICGGKYEEGMTMNKGIRTDNPYCSVAGD